MRVADYIANTLVEEGIKCIFSVTGGGAMHLNNAFSICPGLDVYYNHHEQACAMAAEGFARIDGKLAAICVTSGPGGTNALTGVLGAYQDNIPLLVVSGQVRYTTTKAYLGLPVRQYGEQEFDIVNSIKNMTKYSVMVTNVEDVGYHLHKAIHLARTGRCGPCWIDVPLDIQGAQVDPSKMRAFSPEEAECAIPHANRADIEALADKLAQAKRPLILAGTGIRSSNSIAAFREFVDKLGVPVVTAQAAPDSMYWEHPLYFGPSGTAASRTGNFLLQNCDVLLVLGSRLGFKQTGFNSDAFAPSAYRIVVDIDDAELKKPSSRVDLPINADLAEFFPIISNILSEKMNRVSVKWISYCQDLRARYPVYEDRFGESKSNVNSYYFTNVYNQLIPEDQITCLGNSGSAIAPVYQLATRTSEQRILVNIDCGSMGDDLPLAIGACIGAKRKSVNLITGDGSVHMNIQELQTIVQNKLPIKVVIYNNGGYLSIYNTHKNFFNGHLAGCTPESGMSLPDYGKIATAYGFPYRRCESHAEVPDSIRWLLAQPGYAVLEIMQIRDQTVEFRVASKMGPDGTFITPPLDDLSPFLSREEYLTAQYHDEK